MYKDLEKIFDTLTNLKRLGHLKEFEYQLITDYITHLNSVVKETFENNFELKEDITKLKAQIEVYENIFNTNYKQLFKDCFLDYMSQLNNEKDISSSDE